jgi:hypothetical protein
MSEADSRMSSADQTVRTGVLVGFGLLYTYFLWQAIGTAVELPRTLAALYGLGVSGAGWLVIVLNILAAPACFVAALLLGSRRRPWMLALILGVGLCVLSAVTLTFAAAPDFVNVVGN